MGARRWFWKEPVITVMWASARPFMWLLQCYSGLYQNGKPGFIFQVEMVEAAGGVDVREVEGNSKTFNELKEKLPFYYRVG